MTAILGPSGCGKTTLLAKHCRLHPDRRGPRLPRRRRGDAAPAPAAGDRHGLSELRPLAPHDHLRECRLRVCACRRSPRPRFAGASSRCWSWSRSATCPTWKRASPPPSARRPAATRGAGAGPGGGAQGAPDGRAPVQPGRQGASALAGRAAPTAKAGRDHGHLCNARPGRGAGPGRYGGAHGSGADRPDGDAAGHLSQARTRRSPRSSWV